MKQSSKEFFLKLWEEREHFSFVSDADLGSEPRAHFFSHILPKSTYPRFKFNPENVQFMTLEEHVIWEHHKSQIINDPKWKHVFGLGEKLKTQYNKKN